jgi:hypothetical protein
MTADLSSMGPILKPLMNHASKFAAKQKNGKKKATAAMKVKAKVSIKGGGQ